MTLTTAASSPNPIGDLFSSLAAQLLTDVEGNAAGLLSAFFKNIQATPTTQNVMAQGAILAGSALLQLPNLEGEAISQLATTGLQALTLIPKPSA